MSRFHHPEGNTSSAALYAESLRQLVAGRNTDYRLERSFKLLQGSLLANRFLLSIQRHDMGPRAGSKIIALCVEMGMPDDYLEMVARDLPDVDVVHAGFEQGVDAQIYKLYLEFPGIYHKKASAWKQGDEPIIIHRAFKWNPAAPNEKTIASYLGYPGLTPEMITSRIGDIYQQDSEDRAYQAACRILEQAVDRGLLDIFYLEVSEQDNSRRSFDFNIYDADLTLNDVMSSIELLFEYYAVDPVPHQSYLETARGESLGHIAGGIGRNGSGFNSVYYGVELIKP